jgi:hypothetical protein
LAPYEHRTTHAQRRHQADGVWKTDDLSEIVQEMPQAFFLKQRPTVA